MRRAMIAFRIAPLVGAAVALGVLLWAPPPAAARKTDYIPDELVAKKKKKKKKAKKKKLKNGWFPDLDAGFSFAFSQSQGVVGVPDGVSMALGLQLKGGLVYRYGAHEWVSRLSIVHIQSKIPNIDPFIKSADHLELSTLYQYRFPRFRWFGVFGGVRMSTALMPGSLVPRDDTNIDRTPADTTDPWDLAVGQKPYQLTDALAPLLLKQFAGALVKPFERKWMKIDIRLGLGAVEVSTRDGYVVNDNKETADVLELKQLQDYVQTGVELQVGVGGLAFDKILTYGFQAEIMYPFVTSVDTDLSGAELFNTEFRFTLGIKLWKWFSLKYALAVLRLPLIQKDWQVTNSLMLAIKASIVK